MNARIPIVAAALCVAVTACGTAELASPATSDPGNTPTTTPTTTPTSTPTTTTTTVAVTGTINGTVRDDTGGVLPGVLVQVSGPVARSVTTNSSGNYSVPSLPLGTYTVTVPALSASKPATLTSSQPNATVNFP